MKGLDRGMQFLQILAALAGSEDCEPIASASFVADACLFDQERMDRVFQFLNSKVRSECSPAISGRRSPGRKTVSPSPVPASSPMPAFLTRNGWTAFSSSSTARSKSPCASCRGRRGILLVPSCRLHYSNNVHRAHIRGIVAVALAFLSYAPHLQANPLDRWTWRYPRPQGCTLRAVTYGNGLYVAVGDSGAIVTSGDGHNWTNQSYGTFPFLCGVGYA